MMKQIKIALLVSGLMLCLALFPFWPPAYYAWLRIVVCATCGYTAFYFKQDPLLTKHVIPLAALAILFNPFVPVYLDPTLWVLVYLGTAICLLTMAKKINLS